MLFAWANKKLEQLVETIAPIGSDASCVPNKFLAALASGNEDLALSILRGEIQPDSSNGEAVVLDAHNTIFNNSKGTKAIHVACQHCASRVIHTLVSEYRISIDTFDYQGNTGLHYAAASNHGNALSVVKTLVQTYNGTVTLRNANNQSAYDVSSDTLVRQYLLPLQLQRETQDALDSGGPLPPGTDVSSHRLHASQQFAKNNAPPTAVSAPPSLHSQLPPPNTNRRMIPNDGFHSSASDPDLQRKYGHVAPQPMTSLPPPPVAAAATYTGGRIPTRSKYLAYDAVTGMTSSVPTPVAGLPPLPPNPPQQTFNPISVQSNPQPPNNFQQQPNVRAPPMHMNSSPPALNQPPFQTPIGSLPPPPQMNRFTPSAVASTAATFSTPHNATANTSPAQTASNVFSSPVAAPVQSPPVIQSSPMQMSPAQTASNVFSSPVAAPVQSSPPPTQMSPPPMQSQSNQSAANFFSPPPGNNASDVFSAPPS